RGAAEPDQPVLDAAAAGRARPARARHRRLHLPAAAGARPAGAGAAVASGVDAGVRAAGDAVAAGVAASSVEAAQRSRLFRRCRGLQFREPDDPNVVRIARTMTFCRCRSRWTGTTRPRRLRREIRRPATWAWVAVGASVFRV